MRRVLSLFCFSAATLSAQGLDHVVVVTHSVVPATSLLDVDLGTGAVQPIGGFSLDRFPPLAVAVDAVNRDVVVALQTPAATSVLVRLRLVGTRVVREASLGDVPGTVTALTQALDGTWITLTAAGVMATERNGSVARRIAAAPLATAIETYGLASTQALVVQSGSPTADPQLRWLDLVTGQTIAGPFVYTGYLPRGLTGVGDLPTGAARQVFSQEDGTVAISVNFALPATLPLSPVLPAGATVAMHVRGLEGVVLGGSAHPFLKSFQALGGTQWVMLAGPLPGDPVDFAFRPPVVAATVAFGGSCGRMSLQEAFSGGPPRLGSTSFALQLVHGTPSSPAVLVLGASDQRYLGLRLPALLPGGCRALVSAEVVVTTSSNGFGEALLPIAVPNDPVLLGAIVFGQWLQVPGGSIDTSNAAALWLGR